MKELVIAKVGTSSLVDEVGRLEEAQFTAIADQLVNMGDWADYAIVTSGAVSAGMEEKGVRREEFNGDVVDLQYYAAIGQPLLMERWREAFRPYGKAVGQCLITNYEFSQPQERQPFLATINNIIVNGDIPILNENDPVANDEIRMGDNDKPAVRTGIALARTGLWSVCSVVMLTDVDGLYENFGTDQQQVVSVVENAVDVMHMVQSSGGVHGTGDMVTKLEAYQEVYDSGENVKMIITNARTEGSIQRALDREIGTVFLPRQRSSEYSAQKASHSTIQAYTEKGDR